MNRRHQTKGTLSISDELSNSDEVEGVNSNN